MLLKSSSSLESATILRNNQSAISYELDADKREQLANVSSDGAKCLLKFWNSPYPEGLHCNATWDSFVCWPTTPANKVIKRSCQEIMGIFPGAENAQAFRVCDSNGHWLWEKTNYSECLAYMPPGEDKSQHEEADTIGYLMFFGSLMSFLALTITLFIFFYFKSLRCDRISVHKHLSIALLIRFILNIIMTEPIIAGRNGSYTNEAWICRLVLILKMYATVACVNWMFIEGLYLHSKVTTSVFSTKSPFRLYYVLGWMFPVTIVTLWGVMMSHSDQKKCWAGYARLKPIWIITVPITAALAMNLLFLINIIRILVTKLRASVAIETTQVRKAIKATALLFPLLGLPNLFVCINPKDKGDFEDVYLYTNTVLESSQGIFVAVLYCFTNSEVIEVIRKQYNRLSLRWQPSCNNNRRKSSRSVSFAETANVKKAKKTFWVKLSNKYKPATTSEVVDVPTKVFPNGIIKNGSGPECIV